MFDAMHAVTGPYAKEILVRRLGADPALVLNATPLEDFGGHHPDPNLVHAKALYDTMMGANAPDFGAASDGDGDRNLIIGKGVFVTPSDSLAMLAANAHLAPGYKAGLKGIARSMPTSGAADRVAEKLGVEMHETPTGWKFFGNLLDAGRCTICGEESAGTGSDHVREKDGLWAILLWLNILAVRRQSVSDIVNDHWTTDGRTFYSRHDYEAIESEKANQLMKELEDRLPGFAGPVSRALSPSSARTVSPIMIRSTDRQAAIRGFASSLKAAHGLYSVSRAPALRATLRVYMERHEPDPALHHQDAQAALAPLSKPQKSLAGIRGRTGRDAPSVIT
jgi:phosphoglucomutase